MRIFTNTLLSGISCLLLIACANEDTQETVLDTIPPVISLNGLSTININTMGYLHLLLQEQ